MNSRAMTSIQLVYETHATSAGRGWTFPADLLDVHHRAVRNPSLRHLA
ncbi:hypothetical protein [Streptomyces brevispora]|uniref:Uncharacterized protein n=1 Tax=Streptomyces brevispora TaxID=887462 RepID=A0A561V6K8_9ACTN|nr:hypothetical protein [Streptomyces brevispora]TWG07234.1 hypothetical protein FHX80_115739 [Streptomyces brevispora]